MVKAIWLAMALAAPALAAEPADELAAARIEILKLRLALADEKLINARIEFNLLIQERQRLCNELSATDQKTWTEKCTERKP
jgi:hypothetical protein